jgi:putative hydrolase of the HAD superfamily
MDSDAVVFDLGDVLVTYDPLAHLRTRFPEPLATRIYGAVYGSSHWLEMDRGVLAAEEIFARMAMDAPDMAGWIRPALATYPDILQPIPESVAYLSRLKEAGYRLYVLSNVSAEFFSGIRARNSFFELFDGLLISGEERVIKPDPAIYLLLFHRFGLMPARTLFVDDRVENIKTAMELGMQGMVFTGAEQLETLLV